LVSLDNTIRVRVRDVRVNPQARLLRLTEVFARLGIRIRVRVRDVRV
jgi:hypothetical protein